MFQPDCWRTLLGSQPPKPPPQCFVCRPDQMVTIRLPYLQTGVCMLFAYALTEAFGPAHNIDPNLLRYRVVIITDRLIPAASVFCRLRPIYNSQHLPQVRTRCLRWRCLRCRC